MITVRTIPLNQIRIGNEYDHFALCNAVDPDDATLQQNIAAHGLQCPINVGRDGDHYRIIDGYRRFVAIRNLGHTTIEIIDHGPMDEVSYLYARVRAENKRLCPYVRTRAIYEAAQRERAADEGRSTAAIAESLGIRLYQCEVSERLWSVRGQLIRDFLQGHPVMRRDISWRQLRYLLQKKPEDLKASLRSMHDNHSRPNRAVGKPKGERLEGTLEGMPIQSEYKAKANDMATFTITIPLHELSEEERPYMHKGLANAVRQCVCPGFVKASAEEFEDEFIPKPGKRNEASPSVNDDSPQPADAA